MFFFLKLALGNIVKNRRNTATIIIAVFISVFFMEFTFGYMDGFKVKLLTEGLDITGHVKIYNKKYHDNLDFSPVEYNINLNDSLDKKIRAIPGYRDYRAEINFGAIANSETANQETLVKAVDFAKADGVYKSRIKNVTEGSYPHNDDEIIIGYKMAKMLKVKPGERLILFGMDQYGSMNAVEGKISGIFNNHNPVEDEQMVLCSIKLAQQMLAIDGVTEIFILLNDPQTAQAAAETLQKTLPDDLSAIPWQTEQPLLEFAFKKMDIAIVIILFIILFVAALGIVNSFLMNIMGRMPEFGVLRAIGISKFQLFMMILTESLLLGIIGTIAGIIPGVYLVWYFQVNPISYEELGNLMSAFGGIDALIGTAFVMKSFIMVVITGILISVAASVYPAISAVNRKPVDILRVLE